MQWHKLHKKRSAKIDNSKVRLKGTVKRLFDCKVIYGDFQLKKERNRRRPNQSQVLYHTVMV